MKKLIFVAASLLAAACADDNGNPRTFANNDLELAVGNTARMGCTCMFVMNMPESYCTAWVKASPDVAKISYDTVNKQVSSSALVSVTATAKWVDAKRGCVLQ